MANDLSRLVGTTIKIDCIQTVSARAQREIRDRICSWYSKDWFQVEPYLIEIGNTWEGRPTDPVKGTWPKRMANWLYKKANISLTDTEKAKLGEIARRGMVDGTFYGRVVDEIYWDSGEFGDEGSCFWSGRSLARRIIPKNGGGAIQWFTDKDMYESNGCARALILPAPRRGYVLFNAYGSISLETSADAIAQHFDLGVPTTVEFRDNGDRTADDFWINGGKGILVTDKPTIRRTKMVNLKLVRPKTCQNCGKLEPIHDPGPTNVDDYLCPSCIRDSHVCSNCQSRYVGHTVVDGVCHRCYARLYDRCRYCRDMKLRLDLIDCACAECFAGIEAWKQQLTMISFESRDKLNIWIAEQPSIIREYIHGEFLCAPSYDLFTWFHQWIVTMVRLEPGTTVYHERYGTGVVLGEVVEDPEHYAIYWTDWTAGVFLNAEALSTLIGRPIDPTVNLSHVDIHHQRQLSLREITRVDQSIVRVGTLVNTRQYGRNHYGRVILKSGGLWLIQSPTLGWHPSHDDVLTFHLDLDRTYYWIREDDFTVVSPEQVPLEVIQQLGG